MGCGNLVFFFPTSVIYFLVDCGSDFLRERPFSKRYRSGYRVFFVLWEVELSTFPHIFYIVSVRVRANIPDQDSVSSPHESVSLFDFHFFHPVKQSDRAWKMLSYKL